MNLFLRKLQWVFVLTPIFVTLLTEAYKTSLIGYFRLVDFVDLVFLAPFFLIMLLTINRHIFAGQIDSRLFPIALGLMGVTLYGHAMHVTGNTINTYSTEIQNYKDGLPPDTYWLIYFFDENLSHWLIYTGLIGSLGVWILADQPTQQARWHDLLPGILLGVSYSIAIIESSQPWMGIAAFVWLVSCAIWKLRCFGSVISKEIVNALSLYAWFRIGILTAFTLLIGEIVYLLIFGSFVQPSQMGS